MLFAGPMVVFDDRLVLVVAPVALDFEDAAALAAGQIQRGVAGLEPRAVGPDCREVHSPLQGTLESEILGLFLA